MLFENFRNFELCSQGKVNVCKVKNKQQDSVTQSVNNPQICLGICNYVLLLLDDTEVGIDNFLALKQPIPRHFQSFKDKATQEP